MSASFYLGATPPLAYKRYIGARDRPFSKRFGNPALVYLTSVMTWNIGM